MHFDNSLCLRPRRMPPKAQIVDYWKETARVHFRAPIDWGEPECWACAYSVDAYPVLEDPEASWSEITKLWNKHPYLDRAHIIPLAKGGCNCAANLVLLCKECHKQNPDTKSVDLFLKWVKRRKHWSHRKYAETVRAYEELDYEPEADDWILTLSEPYKKYLLKNAVVVGGKISLATSTACFLEFKAALTAEQTAAILKTHREKHSPLLDDH